MKPKTFIVCTTTNWVKEELGIGVARLDKSIQVEHNYGLDIPLSSVDEVVGIWAPLRNAARLLKSGFEVPFAAPPKDMLSSLPLDMTGRIVETCLVKDITPREGVWKLAEAKDDRFPAQWRTVNELVVDAAILHPESIVQYTPTWLNIVAETRFFVTSSPDRQEVSYTGSVYKAGEWIYYDDLVERALPEGVELFLEGVISIVGRHCPLGYVVDIATLEDGSHVVLEFNPSWCCGFYGANLEGVVRSIIASCTDFNSDLLWVPDAFYNQVRELPSRVR